MDRLEQRYELLQKALNSLNMVLNKIKETNHEHENYTEFRDSSIQRFEYCVDTFWKFMREYIEKKYGTITVASPKPVIKACVDLKLIDADDYASFIKMINDRNLTSHAYNEELAEQISNELPGYYQLLKSTIGKIDLVQ